MIRISTYMAAVFAAIASPAFANNDAPAWEAARGYTYDVTLTNPTDRYGHGALGTPGEFGEWASLEIKMTKESGKGGLFSGSKSVTYSLDLTDDLVFEDVEARLWDVDSDGIDEIAVVQAHANLGARLMIFNVLPDGSTIVRGETPFAGTRHRWIAPVGMVDFDRDGQMDIAVVEQPHLNHTLTIYRFDGGLIEMARIEGKVSNHKFGAREIVGGVYDCGSPNPVFVMADADWSEVIGVQIAPENGQLSLFHTGEAPTPEAFAKALSCEN